MWYVLFSTIVMINILVFIIIFHYPLLVQILKLYIDVTFISSFTFIKLNFKSYAYILYFFFFLIKKSI